MWRAAHCPFRGAGRPPQANKSLERCPGAPRVRQGPRCARGTRAARPTVGGALGRTRPARQRMRAAGPHPPAAEAFPRRTARAQGRRATRGEVGCALPPFQPLRSIFFLPVQYQPASALLCECGLAGPLTPPCATLIPVDGVGRRGVGRRGRAESAAGAAPLGGSHVRRRPGGCAGAARGATRGLLLRRGRRACGMLDAPLSTLGARSLGLGTFLPLPAKALHLVPRCAYLCTCSAAVLRLVSTPARAAEPETSSSGDVPGTSVRGMWHLGRSPSPPVSAREAVALQPRARLGPLTVSQRL